MKTGLSTCLLWFAGLLGLYAQQADLEQLLKQEKIHRQQDTVRHKILTELAFQFSRISPEKGLAYAEEAIALGEKLTDKKFLAEAYKEKGRNLQEGSRFADAQLAYERCLKINEEIKNIAGQGKAFANIGAVYVAVGDYTLALENFDKALLRLRQTNEKMAEAQVLSNIGYVYYKLENYRLAISNFNKLFQIAEKVKHRQLMAGAMNNLGNAYTQLKNYDSALVCKEAALAISEADGDKRSTAMYLSNIGNVYKYKKNYAAARSYYDRARSINDSISNPRGLAADLYGLGEVYRIENAYAPALKTLQLALQHARSSKFAEQERDIMHSISKIDSAQGRYEQAYQAYQRYIRLRDSIDSVEKKVESIRETTRFEFREAQRLQEAQLKTQRLQRNFSLAGAALLGLLSFVIYRNFRNQQKANVIISAEKKKSDDLLLNILPAEVAQELKETGQAAARQFDQVTVLFTDFVSFTRVSEQLTPHELVAELNVCFKAFDEIIERHGLEKIKTIGDAYMAVSGLPVSNPDHARQACRAAVEIVAFMEKRRKENPGTFQIRIGLNSGPIVAGIVGVKKYAYDIWGDTVNTAARMEQNSEPGKINISGATRELVTASFKCEYRGRIDAKNKGEIDMYFLNP